MRVNIAQSHPPPSTSCSLSPQSSQNALPCSLRLRRSSSTSVPPLSTAHNHLRRSCSATFDGYDFPNDHFTPRPKSHTSSITTTFLHHADVLEPSFLGIHTDPPDWPARNAIMRECAARRANCVDIPLSLRMIKMKQKFLRLEEQRDVHFGDSNNNNHYHNNKNNDNSLNSLCCSTLHIIREIQSYALKSRGIVLNEELDDGIVSKIQREMTSSFVWLIKEVFAKTPDLMLQVMVITSNFALFSLESSNLLESEKKGANLEGTLVNSRVGHLELGNIGVPTTEILENMVDNDAGLWNSMVDEADQLRGDLVMDQGLSFVVVDRDGDDNGSVEEIEELLEHKMFEIISPVNVEIESDDYEEYHRTDLLYQTGLFRDPKNTLLLSNYSQFLCLVSRDYDRAEECLKRAIQLDPSDAEIVSQYANFLWIIRSDLWGAEERFQQAMAAEPENSYHASKYANFLWSTGGDETCYPIDDEDTTQGSS